VWGLCATSDWDKSYKVLKIVFLRSLGLRQFLIWLFILDAMVIFLMGTRSVIFFNSYEFTLSFVHLKP
jgi:hypothetical protein